MPFVTAALSFEDLEMKKYEILKNYSRRSVIKGLGATAAAPFLPILGAEAADGSAPKRLLIVTTPSGHGNGYIPTGAGANYQNGPAFKPLDPFKDKINIYRGIDFAGMGKFVPERNETYFVPNSHPALAPHLLTAAWTQRPGLDNGPNANDQEEVYHADSLSIDQTVAQRLMANPETETGLPFIFAGVRTVQNAYYHQVYDKPWQSVYPQVDAATLHSQVFDASAAGGQGVDDAAFNRRIAERRSVIDYAKVQIDAVQNILSTEDKKKMEAHLDGVRELERQLQFQAETGSLNCSFPQLGETSGPDDEEYRKIGENMINIIVQGLACDRARVATLMWGNAADNTIFTKKNISISHHALTHGGITGEYKTGARDRATEWYAERFLLLLQKMSEVEEGDGTSLLDNTLILWTSEHSNETREHDRKNIPFVSAGSCKGAINTGQYFDFTSNRRGHGDIYVTAAQAMGLTDITKFGMKDFSQGPLPGVLT